MPTVTLTLTDNDDGVQIETDFGAGVVETSQAHGMALALLESVLTSAKSYQKIEDTVPEHNVEPSRILTAEGLQHGV